MKLKSAEQLGKILNPSKGHSGSQRLFGITTAAAHHFDWQSRDTTVHETAMNTCPLVNATIGKDTFHGIHDIMSGTHRRFGGYCPSMFL